ncbi:iron-sulfur cluster assembly protein [Streptomyces sp. NPDC047081]|uniref:metal-sulfur cluster assembly factor n=1 Tax=Streptomyces sp. NPDC047081 TaxID=3154706 RepID=UPI0033F21DE4
MSSALDEQISTALEEVHDPCSVAAGAPLGLLDMGLVRDWELDAAGRLTVRLRVTSPLCTMAGHFVLDAEERLAELEGVNSVEVVVDSTLDWTPDSISEKGHRVLEERRALARRRITGAGPAPQVARP